MFPPAVYTMQKHFLTFSPETCLWGNLGRSDLILLSVMFYNFMPLFLVIACSYHLNYYPSLWNLHLASTWTYIISFFQAPCLSMLPFFVIFLTSQPLQSYSTTSQCLSPVSSWIYLYLSTVIQPRTESSIFCLGCHQALRGTSASLSCGLVPFHT